MPHSYDSADSGGSSSSEREFGVAGGAEDANAATDDNSGVVENPEADDDVAGDDLTEADVLAIRAFEGRR